MADGLGIKLPPKAKAAREPVNMDPSPAVSIQKNMKDTLEGRCVGILFADGSDVTEIDKVVAAVTKAKGKAVLIAPKVGGAKLSDGSLRKADGQLAGTPSQLFDAVALVLSTDGAAILSKDSAALDFVANAFVHLKAIGASEGAQLLLDKARVEPDAGITGLNADFIAAAKLRFFDREPSVRTLA